MIEVFLINQDISLIELSKSTGRQYLKNFSQSIIDGLSSWFCHDFSSLPCS